MRWLSSDRRERIETKRSNLLTKFEITVSAWRLTMTI
jgi:hypothetical protein